MVAMVVQVMPEVMIELQGKVEVAVETEEGVVVFMIVLGTKMVQKEVTVLFPLATNRYYQAEQR